MTLARAWARAGEANSSPPRPETTSTSQPRAGRCFANERQRAAGPPAWSIGRCETSSSRFTPESHHTGLRASRGMDESSVVVPVPGPEPARLRTDVFLTFVGKGITLLLTVATVSVVARALGPSGQGLFAVAFTLSLLLVQFGGLGLTTANPYFAARDPAARSAHRRQRRLVRSRARARSRRRGRPHQGRGAGHGRGARLDAAPRHARRHPGRPRRSLPAGRAPR